ncbi:MAG: hypothetical protein H0U86_00425 [Chloroflexi bacterium]|nr:hypothetical protein [Chloroflexota bacterium]
MISRIFGDRRRIRLLRRIDRPAAILLAAAQAVVAAAGWFAAPLWLAVAIAGQLLLGGIVAVRVIGPMRSDLGIARYAIPAAAGIAATLFGRLIPGGQSLLFVPFLAVVLWAVTYLELRMERGTGGGTIGRLLLTAILFAGTDGLLVLFGARSWPTPLVLVAGLTLPLALRSSEGRGTMGVEGFGQALLHVLVVVQVGAGAILLNIPWPVMAALMGLAFYTWSVAAETLGGTASGRSVAIEFGSLVLFGLVVGLILHRP